jgi:hypothetical protein
MKIVPITYQIVINGRVLSRRLRVPHAPQIGESIRISGISFVVKDVEQDLDAYTEDFYSDYSYEFVKLELKARQDEDLVMAILLGDFWLESS